MCSDLEKNVPIIIFDFDSTLIAEESLVTMMKNSTSIETFQSIVQITNQGINHEITMQESYKRRFEIGKPTREMCQVYIDSFASVTPGIKELLIELKQEFGAHLFCVSQGVQHVVQALCDKHFSEDGTPLIEDVLAVPIEWNNMDIMTLSSAGELALERGKSFSVKEISTSIPNHGKVIMIGDGVSDMQVEADVRIAYTQWRDSKQTRDLADYVSDTVFELKQVLFKILSK